MLLNSAMVLVCCASLVARTAQDTFRLTEVQAIALPEEFEAAGGGFDSAGDVFAWTRTGLLFSAAHR